MERDPKDRYEIRQMPDKETLQDYLRGQGGEEVKVQFNTDEGRFERLDEKVQEVQKGETA